MEEPDETGGLGGPTDPPDEAGEEQGKAERYDDVGEDLEEKTSWNESPITE